MQGWILCLHIINNLIKINTVHTLILHNLPKPSSTPATIPCIVADVPGGLTALAYATIVV